MSGGLAIDCGVHEYDLAEWLTGRRVVGVSAWSLPIVDAGVGSAGDVDNLVAVLELDDGAVATVDLSRNARFGDDVRTEVLGSSGAVFVDLLPTGRARIGDGDGVRDAAWLRRPTTRWRRASPGRRGRSPPRCAVSPIEVPGAAASARATSIGQAVIEAARTRRRRRGRAMTVRGSSSTRTTSGCATAPTSAFVELARARRRSRAGR